MHWFRDMANRIAAVAVVAFVLATSVAVAHEAEHDDHAPGSDSCVVCRIADHSPVVFDDEPPALVTAAPVCESIAERVSEPSLGWRSPLTARGPPSLPHTA